MSHNTIRPLRPWLALHPIGLLCLSLTATPVPAAAQTRHCGKVTDASVRTSAGPDFPNKMEGGTPVAAGGLPAAIALVAIGDGSGRDRVFCGGTLLSDRFVLTAAHCVGHIDDFGNPFVRAPSEFYAFAPHNRSLVGAPGTLTTQAQGAMAVSKAICHAGFTGRVGSADDIAVIELAEAPPPWAYQDAKGRPHIALPKDAADDIMIVPVGSLALVAGWGSTKPSGLASNSLLQAELKRLAATDCGVGESVICLGGGATAVGACGGDSGGFAGKLGADGRMLQIGVVSAGPADCGGSAKPGRYSRVSAHIEFIRQFVWDAGR